MLAGSGFKKLKRVDAGTVSLHFKVKVFAGAVAGGTDFGNNLAFGHPLSLFDQEGTGMGIQGGVAVAVFDLNIISV